MTQAVSTPEHSTHRQSEDDVAIHCQHVNKEFVETVEGSRRWSNWFRGERRVVKAVDDVSFKVQRGEIFGLLGPNGSGKSTLIRLLSTLLFPDSGTVTIFGKDVVRHQHEVRRWINRVSVEASFFKKLSAMEKSERWRFFGGWEFGKTRYTRRWRIYPGGCSKKWQSPGL
jgi:ABC-2 type transport system ATP-binding protein